MGKHSHEWKYRTGWEFRDLKDGDPEDSKEAIPRSLQNIGAFNIRKTSNYEFTAEMFKNILWGFGEIIKVTYNPDDGRVHAESRNKLGWIDSGINGKNVTEFYLNLWEILGCHYYLNQHKYIHRWTYGPD